MWVLLAHDELEPEVDFEVAVVFAEVATSNAAETEVGSSTGTMAVDMEAAIGNIAEEALDSNKVEEALGNVAVRVLGNKVDGVPDNIVVGALDTDVG